jgi:hypothetical protein
MANLTSTNEEKGIFLEDRSAFLIELRTELNRLLSERNPSDSFNNKKEIRTILRRVAAGTASMKNVKMVARAINGMIARLFVSPTEADFCFMLLLMANHLYLEEKNAARLNTNL